MKTKDEYPSNVLIRKLYERSKTTDLKQDADLMYQASITIGVLETRIKQLMHENPDDDLHG